MKKKMLVIFCCFCFLLLKLSGNIVQAEKGEDEPTNLYARSAVLMDADSGRILFGKDERRKLPMASTTKIMTCILVLEQMQEDQNHMAIVIDEYGQTAGIVTMEDILEEIFGNIQDEYDQEEEQISRQPDGTYLVNGMAELQDLELILGISFQNEDEFDTLNGFLIDRLDHIPSEEEGCIVAYEGYHFHIQSVEDNTIQTVRIHKLNREN